MYQYLLLIFVLSLQSVSEGQVLLFGDCKHVETMKYFELERVGSEVLIYTIIIYFFSLFSYFVFLYTYLFTYVCILN